MSDREDIGQLIARASDATSRWDAAAFAAGWAPQATWIIDAPLNMTLTGTPDELAGAFVGGMNAMWTSFLQLTHQSVIDVDADAATARTYITEQGVRADGVGQVLHGVYDDELVRTDAGWRFAKRHFHYLHLQNEPIPGLSARGGQLHLP